jgi:hypothetical protein
MRRLSRFTENEVAFSDGRDLDHDTLGRALHRAVYNYMYGAGLDTDVRAWFDRPMPRPRLRPTAVVNWTRG